MDVALAKAQLGYACAEACVMTVRTDPANRVVSVDATLDIPTAQLVRDEVLQIPGEVRIDVREARDVQDSALMYLVTTLRLADRQFRIEGLWWPHTRVLEYVAGR